MTESRRALVLGASSEIGMAVVRRLLDDGASILAHYSSDASALSSLAPSVELVQADLTDIDVAVDLARSAGPVDILVCLAARATPTWLTQPQPREWASAIAVGALSSYAAMGIIGPGMVHRSWGRIVVGSSIGVRFGGGLDSFAYALANHASEFLPRATRDWAAHGVLTNIVRIGVTDTSLHSAFPNRSMKARAAVIPMGRPATVDEVADFVHWHATERNSYVTGQVVTISGGE